MLAYTGATLNDGLFHHIAITRKAGVEVKFYIDSVNVQTTPAPNTAGYSIAADVFIGKLDPIVEAQFSVNESFNGLIDEVEVFNRALLPGEIQGIYNADAGGKCLPGKA